MLHQAITTPTAWSAEAALLIEESNRFPVNSPDWLYRRRAAAKLALWDTDAAPRDYAAILAAREAQGLLCTPAEIAAMEGRA